MWSQNINCSYWSFIELCSECNMRYNGRDKYWAQHEVNMLAGGGSVDRAPDLQRTNASSKLERRKYSFITTLLYYAIGFYFRNVCIGEPHYLPITLRILDKRYLWSSILLILSLQNKKFTLCHCPQYKLVNRILLKWELTQIRL